MGYSPGLPLINASQPESTGNRNLIKPWAGLMLLQPRMLMQQVSPENPHVTQWQLHVLDPSALLTSGVRLVLHQP